MLHYQQPRNIYSYVLDLIRPYVDDDHDIFVRAVKLGNLVSDEYFKTRPCLNSNRPEYQADIRMEFDKQLEQLHRSDSITPLRNREFCFRDNEIHARSQWIDELYDTTELARLQDVAYQAYAEKNIASPPGCIREYGKSAESGFQFVHDANDFAAAYVFHVLRDKITADGYIKILDLGSGTGGTCESLVTGIYKLAHENELGSNTLTVDIDCVECADDQLLALKRKISLLEDWVTRRPEQFSCRINLRIIEADFYKFSRSPALYGGTEKYHAVVSNFAFHHVTNTGKRSLLKMIYNILGPKGAVVINDCDGLSDINQCFFNWHILSAFSCFASADAHIVALSDAGFSAYSPFQVQDGDSFFARYGLGGVFKRALEAYTNHCAFLVAGTKD